jgi:hypothetical protein
MPLQNRVHPNGELHAVPERGTMLGNRGGKFHLRDQTLGRRRWASKAWICCELQYKGLHHEAMGQGYTSLFFLDEVTALAAGHRPCFFCRRAEAKWFVELSGVRTQDLDEALHHERINALPRQRESYRRAAVTERGFPSTHRSPPPSALRAFASSPSPAGAGEEKLPDAAMIDIEGVAFAVRGRHLLRWSFAGYTAAIPRSSVPHATVLTSPAIIGILSRGYQPRWHPSASEWGTS